MVCMWSSQFVRRNGYITLDFDLYVFYKTTNLVWNRKR